jgi:hypothetical protein
VDPSGARNSIFEKRREFFIDKRNRGRAGRKKQQECVRQKWLGLRLPTAAPTRKGYINFTIGFSNADFFANKFGTSNRTLQTYSRLYPTATAK